MENKIINEYEIDNERRVNELRARRIAAIALALTAGGSVLTACSNTQTVKNETTEDKKQESMLEETTAEIDKIYEEVNQKNINEVLYRLLTPNYKESEVKILDVDMSKATKEQEEFLNKIYGTITKYHEQTHKENNFRLSEDGDYYLDLLVGEVFTLNLLLNNYSQEELNEVMGAMEVDSETLKVNLLNSCLNLSTYYMTAVEPSGISSLIKDEKKKELFERIERKALDLNKDYSEEKMQDFLSEEIVQAVFNQDKEALKQMDIETLFSAIPVMSVAQRRIYDSFLSTDIAYNVLDMIEIVTEDKRTKLEEELSAAKEYYSNKIDISEKTIAEEEEKEVEKLTLEAEKKFKKVYGTELKEYMSEVQLNKFIKNFYENKVYESNVGLPFSEVYNNYVNYDLLEGEYPKSEEKILDDVLEVYRIRIKFIDEEFKKQKQSYNDEAKETKELAEEKAKVRTLKRNI